jgi:formate-dependent nitrite reductase cytochrome c552 subunit
VGWRCLFDLTWRKLGLWLVLAGACQPDQPREFRAPPAGAFTSVVNQSARLKSIEAPVEDGLGQPARIGCPTCHASQPPRPLPVSPTDLKEFHVGLTFRHGDLACAACHVAGRPDMVHLADGALLAVTQALRLCAQCHGPQYRDYQHGSHGGMNGHWDLRSGPRLRNHCVDCHDPHAPQIAAVQPAPPPRDRFAPAPATTHP